MIILLVCHDPLSTAMKNIIESSFKTDLRDIKTVNVKPEETIDSIVSAINSEWEEAGKPKTVIALTDLQGASPSNGLHAWLMKGLVDYIGFVGVNIPMLISAVNHRFDETKEVFKKISETSQYCSNSIITKNVKKRN
ncbi:MAG: hypothetical protein CBC42_02520 [Betaproteobacteria bacterium TMED82]|nr:MAG: hypothetical protein CBC42_02520 [Betaproteobacteria bacterium TMED82]|tara:strand:- start:62409 stop:62819 length:411 start_codon:yes stop_codon:yes gene_type:complete